MRDLGYVEGKNIEFAYRSAEANSGRWTDLAAELVRLNVDLIVTDGTGPALGAKKVTSTIPIVMISSTDPVGTGLVASLARPGGNVTGLTSLSEELDGKMLELLKDLAPKTSRVAILRPDSPGDRIFVKNTHAAAKGLGIYLTDLIVRDVSSSRPELSGPGGEQRAADEITGVFQMIVKERAQALLVRLPPPPRTPPAHRKQVVQLTAKHRLSAIYNATNWVESGGLMSYGSDAEMRYYRIAKYVDKIVTGAKPAELPIEQPTKLSWSST
jgi:putative ABC transport system substrate-binding protein